MWSWGRATEVPQWGPGAKPRQGSGERSPPEAGALLKYTTSDLMPGKK